MSAGSWLTALNTRKMDYALVIAAQKRRISAHLCSGLTGRLLLWAKICPDCFGFRLQ